MLDVITFGRQLVETNDLDPVYTMLWKAQLSPPKLRRWLMAYWLFYDVGTASFCSEFKDEHFWRKGCMVADSMKYPRGTERRHFRGRLSEMSIVGLMQRPVDWYFRYATTWTRLPVPLEKVMTRVQTWDGFGPWIAFKVADMLERLNLCRIDFSDADTFLFDSPKEGAALVAEKYGKFNVLAQSNPSRFAVDFLRERLGQLTAPPRHERKLNGQEFETILCKWKSHLNGKYEVGKDSHEICHSLLRFAKCSTSQRLLKCL